MNRDELKEIISMVIKKMEVHSPKPACGLFFADEPQIVTFYGITPEQPTTRYAINEEDGSDNGTITTLYSVGEED